MSLLNQIRNGADKDLKKKYENELKDIRNGAKKTLKVRSIA